jgi:type I restriction enzyme M protein
LGDLADNGIIEIFDGHGSPPGNARATGDVPYVKVTDLKNWRINENPTNFIHHHVADNLRRNGVALRYGDLLTPSRASSNIGQFSLVLPWQTNIVLTKEVLIIRVKDNQFGITPFLLITLMSLKIVQEQYKTLALMQTNREHLGDHWREVKIPIPKTVADCAKIGGPTKAYFEGIIEARKSWSDLTSVIDPSYFGTRP